MDLTPLPDMLDLLAEWRRTAVAAEQDVRDAEARLSKAKAEQYIVECNVSHIQQEVARLIDARTKAAADLFGSDG